MMNGYRGQVYFQAWPRRRGKTKSPLQQAWIDAFSIRARAFKSVDPKTLMAAQAWTHGTGWYYRDVLERASYGKLIIYGEANRVTTPTVSVSRPATEALTANIVKALTPTNQAWDNNTFWNASINPTRITFKSPGLYLVGGSVRFTDTSTSGVRYMWLRVNGVTEWGNQTTFVTQNAPKALSTAIPIWMNANDYVELLALSNVNSTILIQAFWATGITPEAMINT